MKTITRTVWILSLISLFTDTASEMLYPIMPVFLESIGFSVVLIGILEGIAEATAGLCKGYFGKLSDNSGKRAPFIQLGYSLSAISKPMMILFIYPAWIFFARTIDRFGKGLRTGARDAMLSDEATPQTKGKVFGFHRSMDTLGAVLGPIVALVYLYFRPNDYKTLFLIAFLPGLAAFPIGMIADKLSLKSVFTSGLVLFAVVYLGMALTANIYIYLALFFLYGLYAAATEGIAKAWISNITDPKDTATAIGTFSGFQSLAAMVASSLAGLLWFWFGVETAFIATAVVTVLVIIYFALAIKSTRTNKL